ncbi:MAG TPA: electron transport complex subunit RsxE [Clostridia bacterium]
MKSKDIFLDGLLRNNAIFVMVLGMCPVLGMTNTLANAFWLGIATCIVLIISNLVISLVGKIIPDKVRIPCYIIIIATLVTVVDLALKKYIPNIYSEIGRFVELIVVNCIILARAEAFAASNKPLPSMLDGLSIGLGYFIGLCFLGIIREVLSAGQIWGVELFPHFSGIAIFSQPMGAFLILAILMAIFNFIKAKIDRKNKIKQALLKKNIQAAGGKA